MACVVTHIARTKTTPGSSAVNTLTPTAWTPQANALIVVVAEIFIADSGFGNTTFSVADTFSGSGSWTEAVTHGASIVGSSNTYSHREAIWVMQAGATPGNHSLTVTRTAGTHDQWFWIDVFEVTGHDTGSPIGTTMSADGFVGAGTQWTIPTTIIPSRSGSAVFSGMYDAGIGTDGHVIPRGWTLGASDFAVTDCFSSAYIIGLAGLVRWFNTVGNSGSLYSVAAEIKAATPATSGILNAAQNKVTAAASLDVSLDGIGGSDVLMLAAVSIGVQTGSDASFTTTATYNGTPMTSLSKVHSNGGTAGYLQIFYLVNPSSGTHNVTFTVAGGNVDLEASAIVIGGTNGNAPAVLASATGVSATPGLSVTGTTSGRWEIGFLAAGNEIEYFSDNVEMAIQNLNGNSGAGNHGATYAPGTGGTVAMDAVLLTSDWYAFVGVEVTPAAGAATPSAILDIFGNWGVVTSWFDPVLNEEGWFAREFTEIGTRITAQLISATGSTFTPTISTTASITASLISGTATEFTPTPTATATITLPLVSGSAALFSATPTATATITASLISGTGTKFTPAISTTAGITASLISASGALFAPVFSTAVTITLTLISGSAALFTPTLATTSTIAAPLISGTAAQFTPTLTASASVAAPLISGTATEFTPTISATATIAAPLISGTATEFTPSLATIANIAVPLVSGTATLFAPSLSATAAISASLISGVGALFAPTVSATAAVTASLVSGTATLFTPTLSTIAAISAPLVSGSATEFSPTLSATADLTAPLVSGTATEFTPAPSTTAAVTAPLVSGTAAEFTPTPDTTANVDAPVVSGTATLFAPVVSASLTITTALVSALATLFAATPTTDSVIDAPLIDGSAELFTPSLDTAVTIAAALISGAATVNDSTISATASITTSLISGTGDVYTPFVSDSSDTIVFAPLVSGTGNVFNPTISTTALITAPVVAGSGEAFDPAPSASVTILTDLNNGSVVIFQPTVDTASVTYIFVPLVSGQAVVFEPTVDSSSGASVTLPVINGAATQFGPTVYTETGISTALISATGTLYILTVSTGGAPLKIWNGTTWVTITAVLKRWNGSAWAVETRPVNAYDPVAMAWVTIN